MEKKFRDILNDILNNCVSKNKVKLFDEYIQEYNLEKDDYKYIEKEEKEKNKPNYHKIPIDQLKERLNRKVTEVKDIELDITDEENIYDKCKEILDKINYESKKNKKYYYYAGAYLLKLKKSYNNEALEKQFQIKIRTINKYIAFYSICCYNDILLDCDLSYTDIMNNYEEIKNLLDL